jgi:hypothetical protein
MVRKCPPGVLCIENVTLLVIVILLGIFGWFVLRSQSAPQQKVVNERVVVRESPRQGLFASPSYSFSNVSNDVLMNPYVPPLRNENVIVPPMGGDVRGGVPINVSTRTVNASYSQVGILTRINGPETILPLMGRPLYANRDKWQFYTLSDKNNSVKLPLSNKGKSCTSEYGCDNIYNGDTVYVQGYNDAFKATVYDNATMQYIPYV